MCDWHSYEFSYSKNLRYCVKIIKMLYYAVLSLPGFTKANTSYKYLQEVRLCLNIVYIVFKTSLHKKRNLLLNVSTRHSTLVFASLFEFITC